MAFRKGSAQAEQASRYASFERTEFFKIEEQKPGQPPNQKVLRFITEAFTGHVVDGMLVQVPDDHPEAMGGWITVDMHQNIPTKAKPDDYKGENWPPAMPSVCRYDSAFEGVYSDCYVHDVVMKANSKIKKPAGRQWAWAVEREAVIGDGTEATGGAAMQGKVVGYRDATRIVKRKVEGSDQEQEIEEKALVIVNQGYKNFFGALTGFASIYGTALDRDYVVQRKGAGKETDYNLIPLDPIMVKNPENEAEMIPFDLRNDALLKARYGKTHAEFEKALEDVVTERASDDYYGMWFIPGWKRAGSSDAADGDASAPAADEPGEDEMAALRDRIQGYQAGADGAAPTPPEQPAEAAAAAAAAGAGSGLKSFD